MTKAAIYRHVLLDTGPFVAMRNPHDPQHLRCVDMLGRIDPPLLTCWPVITEAAWLLRRNGTLIRRMLATIEQGIVQIVSLGSADLPSVDALFEQYADLGPQLADLALLHLAQREGLDTVFTLDSRDFRVFRLKGKKALRLLPDDG